ncbi:FAD-binding oxidoreductase [Sphingomonas pokkalii]|uniref:FAD-binding oxidoreductase n=1 Tax=Sphingomonas pokkalii TaxID=2175090 RepID=A0A2U0SH45_9SPHN|nr:FAD-binding oxidoreductase [Sphingomonas pokkalii]PVX30679.1 FAD-binding oxidoreductase [Sphingomonas pokkalii]
MQTDALASLSNSTIADLRDTLGAIVGTDHVLDDHDSLALVSEDIWQKSPHLAALIAAPGSLEELRAVVAAAADARVAIAPRGAGMSYTGGYLPANDRTLSIDMRRMNRVLHIDPDDMVVTVEAGCSWSDLRKALAPHGLRTPFWGPFSGLYSTVGGGMSQNNAMWGGARYGTSSESLVALTIVTGDGRILKTGARGLEGNNPFYRHFGPDLAGLFCGDSGTLGVKAELTLRLIRTPAFEDYASFSFKTGAQMLRAMAEITRAELSSEMCAFDPGLTRVRLQRQSLLSDVKTLGAVIGKQKNLGKGLLSAAKVAFAGRNFIEEEEYPLHVMTEGRSKEGVASDMAAIRAIVAAGDGAEIENTIAKVMRAQPFPEPNSILGPKGEAWVSVHGHASLSTAPAMFDEIDAMFASRKDLFEANGVHYGYLFTSLSTNAITVEPVFYWPEAYRPVHKSMVEPAHLARLPQLPANPAATAVVNDARNAFKDIAARYGCAHFQVARTYPYRESRDDASRGLLDAVKAELDPHGILNPGALGFPA